MGCPRPFVAVDACGGWVDCANGIEVGAGDTETRRAEEVRAGAGTATMLIVVRGRVDAGVTQVMMDGDV